MKNNPTSYSTSSGLIVNEFNICGVVPGPCDRQTGVAAACQYNGLHAGYILGAESTQKIDVTETGYSFNYIDGDSNRTTVIFLTCDPSAPRNPTDWSAYENGLDYAFRGSSSGVCGHTAPPCRDALGTDYSALAAPVAYKAAVGYFSYIFNVCAELPQPCAQLTGVAACQAEGVNQNVALGLVATQAIESSATTVSFRYTGGTDGRKTVITFECDPSAPKLPTKWNIEANATSLINTFTAPSSAACRHDNNN
jgi:hypothetical protein